MNRILEVCLVASLLLSTITPYSIAQTPAMTRGISVQMPLANSAESQPDADEEDARIVTVTATGRRRFRKRSDQSRRSGAKGKEHSSPPRPETLYQSRRPNHVCQGAAGSERRAHEWDRAASSADGTVGVIDARNHGASEGIGSAARSSARHGADRRGTGRFRADRTCTQDQQSNCFLCCAAKRARKTSAEQERKSSPTKSRRAIALRGSCARRSTPAIRQGLRSFWSRRTCDRTRAAPSRSLRSRGETGRGFCSHERCRGTSARLYHTWQAFSATIG